MTEEPWLRPSDPPREPSFRTSTQRLAFTLALVSMSVLFFASLVAFAITRGQAQVWRPEDASLPTGLWASTALLVGVSASAQKALSAVRNNRLNDTQSFLWLTGAFATAFLVAQAFNWRGMAHELTAQGPQPLYTFAFFLLTGLHAAHVFGGYIPLGLVLYQARRRAYSSSRHEGLKLCIHYWHFLGIIWLVLLSVLWWGS